MSYLSHLTSLAFVTALLLACAAMGAEKHVPMQADIDQVAVREDFSSVAAWTAQPSWLTNASPTARVTTEAGVACFAVHEPGKGMKWSRKTPEISLSEMPYLVVRYRAESFSAKGTDYFVYLDEGGAKGQCNALRLEDVRTDEQWHTVAVNGLRVAAEPHVKAIAIQVQSLADGKARVWVDWLMFSDRVPEGATELRAAPRPPAAPDWVAPLENATWNHHTGWLANPCQKPETRREGNETIWRVAEPNLGMKWSWDLPERVKLHGHRYLTLHYRATNCRPWADYALCVVGKPKGDGRDYLPVVMPQQMVADGRWRTLTVDIETAAAQFADIGALAVQVQAGAQTPAELRIDRLALTNERAPSALTEYLNLSPGASFNGFAAADLSGLGNLEGAKLAKRLNIAGWTGGDALTAEGVPFKLPTRKPDLYCSSFDGKEELSIPLKANATEVYLLLWAAFVGDEEPARGTGKLQRIADVDRFRVRLEYADGAQTECLPVNVASKRFEVTTGPQVLCAFAEPTKELRKLTVRDLTTQAVFGVWAVTCRTAEKRLFGEFAEETPPLRVRHRDTEAQRRTEPTVEFRQGRLEMANSHLAMALELAPTPRLTQLANRATGHDCLAGRETEPLVALTLDGKPVATDGLMLAGEPKVTRSLGRVAAEVRYGVAASAGLTAILRVELGEQPEAAFDLAFENRGALPAQMGFAGPNLGWFCLGADLSQNYYLFPKCGTAFHNATANHRARYCGAGMPLQFMSVVNPEAGEGLYLRTEDTAGVWRHYGLRKTEKGMSLGLDYPSESLEPGATRRGVRTVIGVTGGDWHDGFEAYRGWLRTWYKPVAPRKAWFREVFNFRQRFLWWLDPLYDPKAGEFHLEAAVDEAKEKFGGLEYLHIFDWGNCGKYGRIYGRTGDHSPYDYWKGGKDAFKRAIAGVQAQGVRVGLYIEGYLLQEKGKLGEAHGKAWQLIRKDGSRAYWPKSTEMFVCPWVPDWRDVQASTYSARVSELGVDGMYLDQFGFANERKDCYSKEHGHPMPGYAVLGERGCSKRVRDAIDAAKPGVALYSEECPVDVNSQNQDGSFTYAMATTRRTETLVPLNMLRFAIPSFKTFEILICDKPTGTWATGIKWVFFNGEGIWLEGQADEWFAPETLATIRQCHAILREHKDAFTSDAPVPLVPTEAGGVFANFFPTAGKQVYTLYNSRHRTFIGEALRLCRVPGVRYHDAWNERPIEARRDGEFDVLSTTIAPQGVGCIVVTGKG